MCPPRRAPDLQGRAGLERRQPADDVAKGNGGSCSTTRCSTRWRPRSVTNQNVAYYRAAYEQARGGQATARPVPGPAAPAARAAVRRHGAGTTSSSGSVTTGPPFPPPAAPAGRPTCGASWAIREPVQGAGAGSAADLANATLSAQGELASDYFPARLDAQIAMLTTRSRPIANRWTITQNKLVGTVSNADVYSAQPRWPMRSQRARSGAPAHHL
jgi:hypothetical protein